MLSLDILQEGIEYIDENVSYTHPETAGLERPAFLCDISNGIDVPIVATNKGLMVAAMQCLGCFLTKTECPISVFSRVGKKNITDALVASNPEKDGCIGKNNIPRLFTLLTTELGIKLSLDLQDISGLHEYPVPIKDWPVKSLHQPSLVEA